MKRTFALTLSAAAVFGLTTMGSAGAGNTNQKSGTAKADCISTTTGLKEGTFEYNGVTVAWPPNHKYRQATITLTDDDAEPVTDGATIAVVGSHDQAPGGEELVGSGNTNWLTDTTATSQDGTPTATAQVSFRGERSGTEQDGRTYTFTVSGTTDNGTAMCKQVEFTAAVPHDQGNK